MRNLKRALSLALAAIMLLGMMVVGAGAVSYNDFSDRTEIVNKDAVSMLTTLGVIDGKPDGSYAPTEFVTREQMAKMISVIMNQGSDNNDLFVGVPSGLTDVAGNWALGHINYCYSLGIIAGRGDGRFDPTANVTASEAAKMLLVAAGYNPSTEGFVGADWAVNVNAKASALGIFRNYTKSTMADLNRDDAALLIYNALDVEMIQKYEDGYAISFSDHRTILSAMYGVYKVEGVVVANKWAQLQGTNSDAALRDGRTTLDNVIVYSSTTANTTTGEGVRERQPVTFNVDTNVELLGKTVTLFIEKTTILSDSKVLGVSLNDNVNVVKASNATCDEVDDYLKGTGLTCDKNTQYYFNYGVTTAADAIRDMGDYRNEFRTDKNEKFNRNGVEVEVIDNNNDGVVEYVLYLQETLSTVRSYSTRNELITVDGMNVSNDVSKAMDFEDVVFADEVASQDIVLFVEYGGRAYISLPETLVGKMTRVDRDKNDELYITVDGEEYRQSFIPNRLDSDTATDFDITKAKSDPGFDEEVEFIFDSNGYIVAFKAPDATKNYALVLGSAWTQNALTRSGQIKILKTDGTEGTYDINWSGSAKAMDGIDIDTDGDNSISDEAYTANDKTTAARDAKLEGYLGTRDVNYNGSTGYYRVNTAAGSVITYTLDDDNVLTIKSVLTVQMEGTQTRTRVAYIDGINDGSGDVNGQYKNLTSYVAKGTGDSNHYRNGDGTIWVQNAKSNGDGTVSDVGARADYAIDLNTVAFYYYIDRAHNNKVTYGVATGYNEMQDTTPTKLAVAGGAGSPTASANLIDHNYANGGNNVQVYTTKRTDNANSSKLAEVILFNEKVNITSNDYLFVLRANGLTSGRIELNVILEDGTAKTVVVKESNIFQADGSTEYSDPFDDKQDFEIAWRYSDLDGEPKLIAANAAYIAYGYAHLIRNGTIVVNDKTSKWTANGTETPNWDSKCGDTSAVTNSGYYTITSSSKIWDVTDMSKSENDAAEGKFYYDAAQQVVLVVDSRTNNVITGWIWAVDNKPGSSVTLPVGDDMKLEETGFGELTLTSNKTPTFSQVRDLVNAWVEKNLDDTVRTNIARAGDGYTVTVEFEDGSTMTYTLILNNLASAGGISDKLANGEDVTLSGPVDAKDFPKGGSSGGHADNYPDDVAVIWTSDPDGNDVYDSKLILNGTKFEGGKFLITTEAFIEGDGLTIAEGASLQTLELSIAADSTLVIDGEIDLEALNIKAGSTIVINGNSYRLNLDRRFGPDLTADSLASTLEWWVSEGYGTRN